MTKVKIPKIVDVRQVPMAINKFLCITINVISGRFPSKLIKQVPLNSVRFSRTFQISSIGTCQSKISTFGHLSNILNISRNKKAS